jgi:sugar-specific transcriptional regulator TrmB
MQHAPTLLFYLDHRKRKKLSLERIIKSLESLGLSQTDAQVYIYLATTGPKNARDVIKALTINKRQVYRSLKRLRNKGITETNNKHPLEFTAVPFEMVLDVLMEVKWEAAKALQASKEELISDLRAEEKKSNSRS